MNIPLEYSFDEIKIGLEHSFEVKINEELEQKKIISDKQLIKEFPDQIFVPINVSQESMNTKFNSILTNLSKKVKNKIN